MGELRKRFQDKEDMDDEGEEEEVPEKPEDVMRELDTDKDSALSFTELVDRRNLMEQHKRNLMKRFRRLTRTMMANLTCRSFRQLWKRWIRETFEGFAFCFVRTRVGLLCRQCDV